MKNKQLYEKAITLWGSEAQIKQCIEECTELSLALLHGSRGKSTPQEIASEIADVEIMCGQMRVIIGDGLVNDEKTLKLYRLACLVGEGEMLEKMNG